MRLLQEFQDYCQAVTACVEREKLTSKQKLEKRLIDITNFHRSVMNMMPCATQLMEDLIDTKPNGTGPQQD